jgi:flagellum-specific peptidoglycan hydrolase FlgJ
MLKMKNLLKSNIKILFILVLLLFVASCKTASPVTVRTTKNLPTKRKPIVKFSTTIPAVKKEHNEDTTVFNSDQTQVLEATTRVKVTTQLVQDYIQRFQKIAREDMAVYGIPASITLGQGILESGAGTGPLAMQANNHFGIKCHLEWNGPSIKHDDDEAQECFRKYDNADDSYRDHSMFLTSRTRYSKLFKLDIKDYKSWARGLKSAGYATDQKYPDKLISLIDRYNLQQYDTENFQVTIVSKSEITNLPPKYAVNFHQVEKGDTLYSISKKYNTSVSDIKKTNNLADNAISIGQNLKIK